jgi:hypothetical protein
MAGRAGEVAVCGPQRRRREAPPHLPSGSKLSAPAAGPRGAGARSLLARPLSFVPLSADSLSVCVASYSLPTHDGMWVGICT